MNKKVKLKTIWDICAKKYSKSFSAKNDKPFLVAFEKLIKRNSKLLDIGCGDGRITRYFYKKNHKIEGVDSSKEMIKIARKKSPKIKYSIKAMQTYNYKKNIFDGIIVSFSLCFIKKRKVTSTLKNFSKALKPKGKLLIITQYGRNEKEIPFGFDKKRKELINFMTKKELYSYLKKANLRPIKVMFREPLQNEVKCRKICIIAENKKNI